MVPEDINSSAGNALTLNWTYSVNEHVQIALEGTINKNRVDNRVTIGEDPEDTATLTQIAATYRF